MNTARVLKAHNNHAAALLVIGDQEEAYEELRSAVAKTALSLEGFKPVSSSPLPCRPFAILPLTPHDNGNEHDNTNEAAFPWPMLSLTSNETECGNTISLHLAAAVSLYNMGLACHQTYFTFTCAEQRNRLLRQAEIHYLQAYELAIPFDAEILKLGLFINLMEVAYERGDLAYLSIWSALFSNQTMQMNGSYPDEVLESVLSAHLHFTRGLQAARAA